MPLDADEKALLESVERANGGRPADSRASRPSTHGGQRQHSTRIAGSISESPARTSKRSRKGAASGLRAGGARSSPLPDYYIGAHAEADNLTLLTRDTGRYGSYFPSVRLVTPQDTG